MSYCIKKILFQNKNEIRNYVQKLINSNNPNELESFIRSLMESTDMYARLLAGGWSVSMRSRFMPMFQNSIDDESVILSYQEDQPWSEPKFQNLCINTIIQSLPLNSMAFRNAVREDILAFKKGKERADGLFECEISGSLMDWSSVEVDHKPRSTFQNLKNDFKEKYGDCFDIEGQGYEMRFLNSVYENTWRQYHNEHARLRIIRKELNVADPEKQLLMAMRINAVSRQSA